MPKNPDLGADADRVRKEEQARIDEAEQLSEEELAEKEDLLREVGLVVVAVAQHSYCSCAVDEGKSQGCVDLNSV